MKSLLADFVGLALAVFPAGLWQFGAAPALAQDAATAATAQATADDAWREELNAWRAQRAHEVAGC